MPDFETYRRHGTDLDRDSHRPVIAIAGDTISINEPAVRDLRTPQKVDLLYDRDAKILGLRLGDRHNPDAFEVEYPSDQGGRIAAGEFLQHYGITVIGRFRGYWDSGVLCANLDVD